MTLVLITSGKDFIVESIEVKKFADEYTAKRFCIVRNASDIDRRWSYAKIIEIGVEYEVDRNFTEKTHK